MPVRRLSLTVGAVVSLLFFLAYIGIIFFGIWWAKGWYQSPYAWTIVISGLCSGFSVFGGFGFRRLLRRMSSLEIYFFLLFLITLSFDGLRVLNWVFLVNKVTPYFGGVVTRISYFGYFMGLFCLFTSSIYSGEIQYQKAGTLLSVLATLSLALSYSMPVDITFLEPVLLYRVGGKEYLLLVRGGLMVLTLLSFARSALVSRLREEWAICGAVALLMVGREVVFFHSHTFLGIGGILCLLVGSFYFSRKSYAKHLWI